MKMQSPKKLFHMRKSTPLFCALLLSLSARRAWIEIPGRPGDVLRIWSLSARRAWIEISAWGPHGTVSGVALRKESVDRNFDDRVALIPHQVALRKESVDRNLGDRAVHQVNQVALRKESVDRNNAAGGRLDLGGGRSPHGERG